MVIWLAQVPLDPMIFGVYSGMRSILFIDPPAFCTTLAVLADPSLSRRPVAIAPLGADRALLVALSPEARQAGLERGTAVSLARRICPDLIVRPPDPVLWARAHRALHDILAQVAPVIEPKHWGHSYLDITGTHQLFGPPIDVAHRLEREIRRRLGIPIAVGIAVNKLVSESAAMVVKREIGAEIWSVATGHEADFLAPEAVTVLPDAIGRVRERLDDYHLQQIRDVAALGVQALATAFGRVGRTLHQQAHGIDYRPVLSPATKAECRVAHLLATDTNDRDGLTRLLRPLAERLGRRLRERRLAAGRLGFHLRYADDVTARRSVALARSTLDHDLWRAACRALDLGLTRRVAVRGIDLVAEELHDGHGQLELWEDPMALTAPKEAALQRAIDAVRATGRTSRSTARRRDATTRTGIADAPRWGSHDPRAPHREAQRPLPAVP